MQSLLTGNTNTFGGKAVTRRLANSVTVAAQANELSRNGGRSDDVQVLGGAALSMTRSRQRTTEGLRRSGQRLSQLQL